MYASHVGDQQLTFFVSGKLWGRSLIMEDQETGSEWSHILGQGMAGPLKGKSLEIIPSTMTNWKTWLEMHPDTTATMMERTAIEFQTEMLNRSSYFGLGLVHQGQARFWQFDRLMEQPLVNDELSALKVVIFFDEKSSTPTAWNRTSAGKTLRFRRDDASVHDVETDSTWNLRRGIATEGALQGTQLEAVPAIVSFTKAWARFHPDSTSWAP